VSIGEPASRHIWWQQVGTLKWRLTSNTRTEYATVEHWGRDRGRDRWRWRITALDLVGDATAEWIAVVAAEGVLYAIGALDRTVIPAMRMRTSPYDSRTHVMRDVEQLGRRLAQGALSKAPQSHGERRTDERGR
jgi:hypothetical protein